MSFPLRLRQIDPNPLDPLEPLAEVSLERTALPERALAERMGLRISKEFYPGAPEPVVQILNRELKPITLKGKFSDRAERTDGFADAARDAVRTLWHDARRVRLSYRGLALDGLITECEFSEETEHDIGYEIVFDPTSPASLSAAVAANRGDAFRVANRAAQALKESEAAYEELPQEWFFEPDKIEEFISTEWESDALMLARLQVEEAHKRARAVLELIGNEKALNMDDRVVSAARSAWVMVQAARFAWDEWDGSPLGILDQLTRTENIATMGSSLDSLSLALG